MMSGTRENCEVGKELFVLHALSDLVCVYTNQLSLSFVKFLTPTFSPTSVVAYLNCRIIFGIQAS